MRSFMKTITPIVLLFVGAIAFAQTAPSVVLEYFDDESQVVVTDSTGVQYQFLSYGMPLIPGDKIVTRNSSAELRMDPNGTIIKLAPNTEFMVDSLQGRSGSDTNGFALLGGRLRTVAAKVAGANYQIRTNSVVGGVRGTEFGMEEIPGQVASILVTEGSVAFTKIASGQTINVNAGQFANAFSQTFQAVQATSQQLASMFQGLDFKNLKPNAVPGHTEQQGNTPANNDASATEQQSEGSVGNEGSEATGPGPLDGVMAFLGEYLGLEIGSVTIEGTTYSKLIAQPQFQIGKLRMALYLPVIYSNNLFDPLNDWYHPRGNNEWSFGFDQASILPGVSDFFSDLFLKIRYVQWGEQRDPFFFKVGNVNNMTLGHGVIMRNFANDADFPAVRRVGVNLGLDFNAVGFEAVVNDLAQPEIFGGRFYFRPLPNTFRAALGVSAVTDINPAGILPTTPDPAIPATKLENIAGAKATDPLFLNIGTDLDIPIVENDAFSVILFGDVAGMLPYIRNTTTVGSTTITQGFQTDALFYTNSSGKFELRNYGIASGLFGSLFGVDYRLEYRNYQGVFRPGFYDTSYERLRGEYATDLMAYLRNPESTEYDNVTMGIYGEAGFTLFDKIVFDAGYMWPWTYDSAGAITIGENDYLKLSLDIDEGLIPLGFHGGISYERTKFVPTLLNDPARFGTLSLFDANTIVKGELVYPAAPGLDVVLLVTTTLRRDGQGNLVYNAQGDPIVAPSISIETRIGY